MDSATLYVIAQQNQFDHTRTGDRVSQRSHISLASAAPRASGGQRRTVVVLCLVLLLPASPSLVDPEHTCGWRRRRLFRHHLRRRCCGGGGGGSGRHQVLKVEVASAKAAQLTPARTAFGAAAALSSVAEACLSTVVHGANTHLKQPTPPNCDTL